MYRYINNFLIKMLVGMIHIVKFGKHRKAGLLMC